MEKRIRIECQGASTIAINDLIPFQGNLKSLSEKNYERLKNQILKDGFSEPVSVWINEGKNYILNGHQRIRTIQKMVSEGYSCEPIPVSIINADSIQHAKKKLLALASSYGKVEKEGLYEFISESDIDLTDLDDNFNFHELDMDKFIKEFDASVTVDDSDGNDDVPNEVIIVVECKDELQQEQLFEEFNQRGIKCKLM